jgi:hypothetical protein
MGENIFWSESQAITAYLLLICLIVAMIFSAIIRRATLALFLVMNYIYTVNFFLGIANSRIGSDILPAQILLVIVAGMAWFFSFNWLRKIIITGYGLLFFFSIFMFYKVENRISLFLLNSTERGYRYRPAMVPIKEYRFFLDELNRFCIITVPPLIVFISLIFLLKCMQKKG